MEKLIYLDNAATTKTAPEVVEAMLPYFTEYYGNPSSVYGFAAGNKEVITRQRETIAEIIGAEANEIYFTAGGSESDNWALKATAECYENKGRHIITTKIEHHAILHTAEYLEKKGFEVTYLDVDEKGLVLYYSDQCPHTSKYVPLLAGNLKELGLECRFRKIETKEDAQAAPVPFTTYALFYNGAFVTNEIQSEKSFSKIWERIGNTQG